MPASSHLPGYVVLHASRAQGIVYPINTEPFALFGLDPPPLQARQPFSMASNGGEESPKLRVFFIPFFVPSHMVPMTDLACLFASFPGVEPTMVVTPANAALIRPTIDRSASNDRPVRLLLYPFPSVGLPGGVENLTTAPSSDHWRIYKAVGLAQDTYDHLLRFHRPDVVVADMSFERTNVIATNLGIPHIIFHPVGAFPKLVMNHFYQIRFKIQEVENGGEPIAVSDFPGPPIKIPKSELPEFILSPDHLTEVWDRLKESKLESYGVVVNTFHELEPDYCDLFRKVDCKRAWFVGPVSLSCGEGVVERGGGETGAEDGNRCLKWLDTKEEASVVFVCLGSWFRFTAEQLQEMAMGLEASGKPFLWAVRETTEWMPEGWEERVGERGLVVRGWAAQVAILEHEAVGAFLTHCGWSSVLEAVAAGVPMLTWPLVVEQFITERLVVEVMGVGKRVWDGFRSTLAEERMVVPREAIGRVVSCFMQPGGEGEKARGRLREYAAMARAAVAKGGSAHRDLCDLVNELLALQEQRLRKERDGGAM